MNKASPIHVLVFLTFLVSPLFSKSLSHIQSDTIDLFFSEYVEGTGNNQCLELYNPFNHTITANDQYQVKLYNTTFPNGRLIKKLTDPIPAKSTYVICNNSAEQAFLTKSNSAVPLSFDGNEALTLEKNDTVIDIFGNTTCFPNQSWVGNTSASSSSNKTLVRCPCIKKGIQH